MEKLALTCKILYDVDILNKMEKLERRKTHPVIIFKDLFEYFNNAKKFQIKIRNGINIILSDENKFNEFKEELQETSDFFYFFSELHDLIFKELLSFTQNKDKYWCKTTAINILNAVKGGIKGLIYSLKLANPDIENPDIEITRDMIIGTTISIILNIIGNHDVHQGLFDQISYFKCDICKKIKNNVVLLEELICEQCSN